MDLLGAEFLKKFLLVLSFFPFLCSTPVDGPESIWCWYRAILVAVWRLHVVWTVHTSDAEGEEDFYEWPHASLQKDRYQQWRVHNSWRTSKKTHQSKLVPSNECLWVILMAYISYLIYMSPRLPVWQCFHGYQYTWYWGIYTLEGWGVMVMYGSRKRVKSLYANYIEHAH